MARNPRKERVFKLPYLALRRNIGYLAIFLPGIVSIGAFLLPPHLGLQGSISAYYHTEMRNVFVGILFAMGFFLWTYDPKLYDRSYGNRDRYFGKAAAVFAIAVAFFPASRANWEEIIPPAAYSEGLYSNLHLLSAFLLFGSMIYFSYFLFTETKPGRKIRRGTAKEQRNKIYRAMGLVMAACVVLMGLYSFTGFWGIGRALFEQFPPVFFLEGAAILAFGVSWAVKGEALEEIGKGVTHAVRQARDASVWVTSRRWRK